jgi:hypothetical protein
MAKYTEVSKMVEAKEGEPFDLTVPKADDSEFDPYMEARLTQNKVIIGELQEIKNGIGNMNAYFRKMTQYLISLLETDIAKPVSVDTLDSKKGKDYTKKIEETHQTKKRMINKEETALIEGTSIKLQTEKAVLLEFGEKEVWIPKSTIHSEFDPSTKSFVIDKWVLEKNKIGVDA